MRQSLRDGFRVSFWLYQILNLNNPDKIKTPKIDIKVYAKYLLQEGTRDEKREILNCLKTELYLKNQKGIFGKIIV